VRTSIALMFPIWVITVLYNCSSGVDIDKRRFYCESDRECASGYICVNNECIKKGTVSDTGVKECRIDEDCFSDERCVNGACKKAELEDVQTGLDAPDIEDNSLNDLSVVEESGEDVVVFDVGDTTDTVSDTGCKNECYTAGKVVCDGEDGYRECIKSEDGCMIWSNKRYCSEPPKNYCVDSKKLRVYDTSGKCVNDRCEYGYNDKDCLNGCENGMCKNCTPDCSNKDCGDDGCGGSCGSCTNVPKDVCIDATTLRDYSGSGYCSNNKCTYNYSDTKCQNGCTNGACRTCNSIWKKEISGVFLKDISMSSDGYIYMAGKTGADDPLKDGDKIYVVKYDICGEEVASAIIPKNVRSTAQSIILDSALYVGGVQAPSMVSGDRTDGFVLALNKDNLSVINYYEMDGGSNRIDWLHSIAPTRSGVIWGVGTANDSTDGSTIPHIWLSRLDLNRQEYCSWDPFLPSGDTYDYGLKIIYNQSDGRVYFVGRVDTFNGFVSSYSWSECGVKPCECSPTGNTVKFSGPSKYLTHPLSLVTISGDIYTVGIYSDQSGVWSGFLARISGNTVTLSDELRISQRSDGLVSISESSMSNLLLVSGFIDYDQSPSIASAKGIVMAYDRNNLSSVYTLYPSNANVCWSVKSDPMGGIVVLCDNTSGAMIMRCTNSGLCP